LRPNGRFPHAQREGHVARAAQCVVVKRSSVLALAVWLLMMMPASAQLFSSVTLNGAELGGFAPPTNWSFFSQEFWAVERWHNADNPPSMHVVLIAIDRGRLANIADDAIRVAGLTGPQGKPFTYSGLDAAADAIASGAKSQSALCGASFVGLNTHGVTAGRPVEFFEALSVRVNLAWSTVVTRPAGVQPPDSAIFQSVCPSTVAAAVAQAPARGWTVASPSWLHLVATWTTPEGSVDFIKVDPAAAFDDVATPALLVADAAPGTHTVKSTSSEPRCGKEARVVELTGPADFIHSGRVRETLVRGKSATYALVESESPKATLPEGGVVATFCPSD
jgi:hypothetical protein